MRRRLRITSLVVAWCMAAAAAHADEDRLRKLATELRCPVCQNQSLADSDADLAADLRTEIRRQLDAGRSDDEIRRFMVERYGEFVLYDPPLQWHTLALWAGPFALLVAGAAVAWRRVSARWRAMADTPGERSEA
nr:cytochrome c-type biogenesis protein [uncultured Caldimonas sp.]